MKADNPQLPIEKTKPSRHSATASSVIQLRSEIESITDMILFYLLVVANEKTAAKTRRSREEGNEREMFIFLSNVKES